MPRPRRFLPHILLAAAVLACFGWSLRGDFVWDDRPLIVENRLIRDPAALGPALTSSFWQTGDRHDRFRSFFRPLTTATYALDYFLWGLRPFGFHLTNLLLHLACCLAVFALARRETGSPAAALAGSLLFAVHPVHVESVAWISGRTDLLATLFVLLAFLARDRVAAAPAPARAVMLSVACFLLGLLAKEVAATLPLLLLAADLSAAGRLRRAAMAAWPHGVALGLYLVARHLVLGGGAEPLYHLSPAAFLGTALFVMGRYLTLVLLPVGLDAHYPYAPLRYFASPGVLVGAAMTAILLITAARLARWSRRDAFWLAWFPIALLPVFAFGSFGDVLLADRFLYLPTAGLAVLLARLIAAQLDEAAPATAGAASPWRSLLAWRPARLLPAAGVAIVVILAGLTVARAAVWRDERTLFTVMARSSPASAMVRCNLGLALYRNGDYGPAKDEFRESIRLVPSYALAHNNLAAALEREGKLEAALAEYLEALRLAPLQLESRVNAGSVLVRLGRPIEGLAILTDAVRRAPRYVPGLYALADARSRTGRPDDALARLDEALAIDPAYPNAYYLRGKILFERGERVAAAEAMRRFLSLWEEEGPFDDAARQVIAAAGSPTR